VAGDGRLIVVFQPYRVYRTRDLEAEMAAALAIADEAVILEVFGPGEVREPGQGGVALTAAIDLPAEAKVFVPDWDGVPAEVLARAREGDVVVTMGAPPISLLGDVLLDALSTRDDPTRDDPTGPENSARDDASGGEAGGSGGNEAGGSGGNEAGGDDADEDESARPPGYVAKHASTG
jgi:UDP-N-acetylmuramate--alanine ligase